MRDLAIDILSGAVMALFLLSANDWTGAHRGTRQKPADRLAPSRPAST